MLIEWESSEGLIARTSTLEGEQLWFHGASDFISLQQSLLTEFDDKNYFNDRNIYTIRNIIELDGYRGH